MTLANKEIEEKKEEEAKGCKQWDFHDEAMYHGKFGNVKPNGKIAGFDMDSTLTLTKGKHLFCRRWDDWKWWHDSVPGKLKAFHEDGYKIVIFTN